jgi:hypothetical protein
MSMFSEKPAETKLLLTLLTFGVTIGGSFGVCWLTSSDPWGAPCLGACLRLLSDLRLACVATCYAIRAPRAPAIWQNLCQCCLR